MAQNKINFKVITHEKIVYENDVDAIYSKGVDGQFGVLPGHIPFMSALKIGVTKIENDNKFDYIATIGGIFQVKEDVAVILTDEAEFGVNIDIPRAKNAKERAEARLGTADKDIDIQRAELALAKAIARLEAGQKYKD